MPRAVLVITIDCLRADHVSAYGYPRDTTPTLDRLAESGVLWEQAHSTASWTKPSVTSMLTGLYPTQHGAFEGLKRNKGRLTVTTDTFNGKHPTLAERLSAGGWRCAAFINNAQLGQFSGLQRGFDRYMPQAGKADRLLEHFAQWLAEDDGRPVFAYLHFLEAHWPYKPRRRHVALFGGNRDTNYFRDHSARDFGRLCRAISRGGDELPDEQLQQMIQMYDGAVRRLDGKLKVLLNLLEQRGVREETALFVTADHGEEFLEHGKIGHGQALYNELTHVPLIASLPGGPVGRRIRTPVSLVDLSDTVARVAGVEREDGAANLLDAPHTLSPVVSEIRIRRRYTQAIRVGDWRLHRRYTFERQEDPDALRQRPHELLGSVPHTVRHELYHVGDDKDEQINLADEPICREARERMIAEMDAWWSRAIAAIDDGPAREVEIDSTVVQRLRELGYVE